MECPSQDPNFLQQEKEKLRSNTSTSNNLKTSQINFNSNAINATNASSISGSNVSSNNALLLNAPERVAEDEMLIQLDSNSIDENV